MFKCKRINKNIRTTNEVMDLLHSKKELSIVARAGEPEPGVFCTLEPAEKKLGAGARADQKTEQEPDPQKIYRSCTGS